MSSDVISTPVCKEQWLVNIVLIDLVLYKWLKVEHNLIVPMSKVLKCCLKTWICILKFHIVVYTSEFPFVSQAESHCTRESEVLARSPLRIYIVTWPLEGHPHVGVQRSQWVTYDQSEVLMLESLLACTINSNLYYHRNSDYRIIVRASTQRCNIGQSVTGCN